MSDLSELIYRRRSHLAFTEQDVSLAQLQQIFEQTRWTASSFNEQPWRFIFALRSCPKDFNRILHCLFEKNQDWAKHAAVLMVAITRKNFNRNENPNRHAHYDVGQAMANFALCAEDLGMSLHQIAGFDAKKAKAELGIPEPFEALTAAALGFPGGVDSLTDELKERSQAPRQRHPLHELFFQNVWGTPFTSQAEQGK